MRPKVSIIIPVYNSEKYIFKCIKSVLSQSYENIEIIVIDDGSIDSSYKILKTYQCEKLKIIQQQNKGVSVARNIGIENSTGEFIVFVDSDDWIEFDLIEKLLKAYFEEERVDLVISQINHEKFDIPNGKYEIKELFKKLTKSKLKNIERINSPVAKLYKTDIIKKYNIKFNPNTTIGEDLEFNIEYLKNIKSIYWINDKLYNYVSNPLSATKKINNKKYKELKNVNKKFEELLKQNKMTIFLAKYISLKNLYSCIKDLFKTKEEKVLIRAYLRKNLGDDLFIKILSERYPDIKFQTISSVKYKKTFSKNIKIKSNFVIKYLNYLIRILSKRKSSLIQLVARKYKEIVWIGGSIFIEGKKGDTSTVSIPENKKYYILGSNFGPYKTEEYFEKAKELYENAQDVCFREKFSYEKFKNIKTTRLAPDIVFSLKNYNKSEINMKEKCVAISVIDCNKRFLTEIANKYELFIIEMIKKFTELNYKIVLLSFCKKEGDERAIKRILRKIKKKYKNINYKKIETCFYRGNIEEILDKINKSSIVIGTRFHANILGILMEKTVIPISYSKKTTNYLSDINFKGKILEIESMGKSDFEEAFEDKNLEYKYDSSELRKESEKQFEILDRNLKVISKKQNKDKTESNNQIKKGIILSYVIILLNIIVNLIYTPILIRRLGQSEYGLYSLVSSIISYLTILDFGFGNAIVLYTTKYRVNNKKKEENKLHGIFFVIYTLIRGFSKHNLFSYLF